MNISITQNACDNNKKKYVIFCFKLLLSRYWILNIITTLNEFFAFE